MLLAIPAFILLMVAEWLIGRRRNQRLYRLNDALTNLNIGVGNQVVGLLYKGVVFGLIFFVYQRFALFEIPVTWWSVLLCAVLYDLIFYWAHRWGHEVNLFWGAHVVHHQSEEYNLSVALRQPWFHHLMAFVLFLPLPLLGFDPLVIGGVSLFSTLYQFWIHTKTIHKLPRPVEYIFNTPSHHRVHHAVNPEYIDKNHGAVLIIWDRLFGTFREEEHEPTYGTTTQFRSMNPAWSNLQYFAGLFRTMRRYPLRDKIRLLFARPGWTPDGPSPDDQVAATDLARPKYDPQVPIGFQLYTLLQFGIIVWALVAYMNHFEGLSAFHRWAFAGMIVLSLVITGGILEKKKWVYFAEFARLLGVAFTVNIFYYVHYIDWFTVMLAGSIAGFLVSAVWFGLSLRKNYREILLG